VTVTSWRVAPRSVAEPVRYRLKYRTGSTVVHERPESADALFARVTELLMDLKDSAPGDQVKAPFRNYDAIEVVHGRIELSIAKGRFGGKTRGGIDVRRDGSAEAFLGRTTRQLIEPRPGESLVDALEREMDVAT
jgi:hypothetical protein